MKRLTLMRHAHAKVETAPVTDFDRPLSRRGKSEAKETALLLLEQGLVPDLIVASPAKRASQTAAILLRELHVSERQLHDDETLYLASADAVLNVIRATGPRIEHLMIVGHNPGISVLANVLAPNAALGEFTTAAACTMDFEAPNWTAVNAGSATNTSRQARAPRLFGLFK